MLYKTLCSAFVIVMTAVNVWVCFKLVEPELQRACVPLYNETAYECCQ